ncbi:MAG: hypothetical protein WC042_02360 [Candidatus Paceibacterota bacterium]|jgi:hypothetical protein
MKIKAIKGRYAWVEYTCGCQEGIWISKNNHCNYHGGRICKVSNTVSLAPPKDLTTDF